MKGGIEEIDSPELVHECCSLHRVAVPVSSEAWFTSTKVIGALSLAALLPAYEVRTPARFTCNERLWMPCHLTRGGAERMRFRPFEGKPSSGVRSMRIVFNINSAAAIGMQDRNTDGRLRD